MAMPANVLVISRYRNYHSSRPEAEMFIRLAHLGFRITIMAYANSPYRSAFEQAGITFIPFHPERRFHRGEIRRIRTIALEHEIDIVHLFNGRAIVNGIQAVKDLPVKIVLYRGFAGNIHWYDPTSYWKYLHPRVDKIICNAKAAEEQLHRQFFFDKRKTVTINKGHEIEWYNDDIEPHDIRQELGISPSSLLLVNVANNRRMKGVPYLLKAMAKLPFDLPVHLLLIGKDMDSPQNLRLIRQGAIQNKVHIVGFRDDVLNIVKTCDAFVLPSIRGETITKSVIEAMSLGVTPIISDIPGNRELVVHNQSGLVVPVKDITGIEQAIRKLYADRDYCRELGQKAQQHICNRFHIDQTVRQVKELYEQLMAGKSSQPQAPTSQWMSS